MNDDWRPRAACGPAPREYIGTPDTVMFPSRPAGNWRNTDNLYAPALAICRRCPVADACLAAAMTEEAREAGPRHGVRGGKTPEQRQAAARRTEMANIPDRGEDDRCGTPAGYRAHHRAGHLACAACRRADAIRRADGKKGAA